MKRWQLAVVLALVCAATAGFLMWRGFQRFDASRLMQSLPIDGAVKVYIDVDALRAAGLLDTIAGPKTAEDPEYRRFADEIGFDYRTDLSAVAAVFAHGDFYAAARGRFDWKRLDDYARAQKGQCDGGICFIPASQPDRYISFYALSSGVLAMAVSGQPKGVKMVSAPSDWGRGWGGGRIRRRHRGAGVSLLDLRPGDGLQGFEESTSRNTVLCLALGASTGSGVPGWARARGCRRAHRFFGEF